MFDKIKSYFSNPIVKSYKRIDKELLHGYEYYRVVFIDEYANGSKKTNYSNILHHTENEAILYAKNFVKCDEIHRYRYSTLDEIVVFPQNYETLEKYGYFVYEDEGHYISFRVFNTDAYSDTYIFTSDSYKHNIVETFISKDYISYITSNSKLDTPICESLYIIESNIVKTNILNKSEIECANNELNELKECLRQYNNITEASRRLIETLYANNK